MAEVTRHSDLREIVAALQNDIALARMLRYLEEGSPDFMVNEVKAGAERMWRASAWTEFGTRLEELQHTLARDHATFLRRMAS